MLTLPHIPDLTDHLEAEDLFAELDELFTCFDLLVQAHSCERLEAQQIAILPLPLFFYRRPALLVRSWPI